MLMDNRLSLLLIPRLPAQLQPTQSLLSPLVLPTPALHSGLRPYTGQHLVRALGQPVHHLVAGSSGLLTVDHSADADMDVLQDTLVDMPEQIQEMLPNHLLHSSPAWRKLCS